MAQHGEVFGPLTHRDATLVLAEHLVEEPLYRVLDPPIPADGCAERTGVTVEAADVEALFDTGFSVRVRSARTIYSGSRQTPAQIC